jgi:hypothetical protein
MIGCLMLPQALWAQNAVDESPVVWLVSLPFTLMAGHASEAAETLMLGPAEATFVRCLGCRNPGYTGRDTEQTERNEEKARAEEQAALDEEHPYVGPSDFP